MLRKALISLIVAGATLIGPGVVLAQENQENCVTVYGGGVVCGVQAPEHEPVDTDLADMNPLVLAGGLLLASGSLLYLSKKAKQGSFQIK